jgi:ceramide glucosyltransferase
MLLNLIYSSLNALGLMLVVVADAYALLACVAVVVRKPAPSQASPFEWGTPPVTVLKPLCGDEPELHRCLRTFYMQDYPCLQIIFGVHHADDPALDTVHELNQEFPELDVAVIADAQLYGRNRKVSNLINMLRAARYEYLVISDSDVAVEPDYLSRIIEPLNDPAVGLVTCEYHARSAGGCWSDVAALFLNEWFIPAVRVDALFGSGAFTSGVTIALRRDTLARIGSFESIVDRLADDYWLGELTRRLGLKTVLSEVVVETVTAESSFAELCRHELRWLRTIRSVNPKGYAFLGMSFSLPVAVLGTFLAGGGSLVLSFFCVSLAARLFLGYWARKSRSSWHSFWMVPVSDTLMLVLWCWSFTSRRVQWRQVLYSFEPD